MEKNNFECDMIRYDTDYACDKHNLRHRWITPRYYGCPVCFAEEVTRKDKKKK